LSSGNVKFIGIGMYHIFQNSSFDNLLKRVRVFNFSNYYNVGDIVFKPNGAGDTWISLEPPQAEESEQIEVFNFLMETKTFTINEISSVELSITLGNAHTYTASLEGGTSSIAISVALSSNTSKLKGCSDCKARINVTIELKNGIKYILPFDITANGNISNIS
jgi:hypothetical protein